MSHQIKKGSLPQLKQNSPSILASTIKQAQPARAPRRIQVQYKSCCGCGCSYDDYTVEVPHDSDIQDGDTVSYEIISKYGV